MAAQNGAGPTPRCDEDGARKVAVLAGGLDNRSSSHPSAQNQESAAGEFYVASDIKRSRRTKAAITDIKRAIYDILSKDSPQTVREQVEQWDLPTRPTKMTDTRAKKFVGTSVELDAIPAAKLRELVRTCIERHVDQAQLKLLRIAEESERELLTKWAAVVRGGAS